MRPKQLRLSAAAPLAIALLLSTSVSVIARDKPDAELAVAHSALEQARRSYAMQYAPIEFDAAQSKLKEADEAVQRRDDDHARRLAVEAEADAQLADIRARRAVAEQNVAQVQQGISTMQQTQNPDMAAPMPPTGATPMQTTP